VVNGNHGDRWTREGDVKQIGELPLDENAFYPGYR